MEIQSNATWTPSYLWAVTENRLRQVSHSEVFPLCDFADQVVEVAYVNAGVMHVFNFVNATSAAMGRLWRCKSHLDDLQMRSNVLLIKLEMLVKSIESKT